MALHLRCPHVDRPERLQFATHQSLLDGWPEGVSPESSLEITDARISLGLCAACALEHRLTLDFFAEDDS
jgi:hypothetical protein